MKRAATSLGVLAGVLTVACSTMKSSVDYDHTVDWSLPARLGQVDDSDRTRGEI